MNVQTSPWNKQLGPCSVSQNACLLSPRLNNFLSNHMFPAKVNRRTKERRSGISTPTALCTSTGCFRSGCYCNLPLVTSERDREKGYTKQNCTTLNQ